MKNQKVYKLRHKETGLFLDPKGYNCNVSVVGKVYSNRKPPRQTSLKLGRSMMGEYGNSRDTNLEDWEVVEYELVEVVENPEVARRPIPDYGDLMTMKEFVNMVDCGMFTDDDGSGEYSDGEFLLGDKDINLYDIDETKSHVVWYNK